jgi:hypothetical protein
MSLTRNEVWVFIGVIVVATIVAMAGVLLNALK